MAVSWGSYAQLETIEKNAGSMGIEYFCDAQSSLHQSGILDKVASKSFLAEHNCKGKFLNSLQVMGIQSDFPGVKCEEGEQVYIVALSGKCLPKSLNAKQIMVVKDLDQALSNYKMKRVH